MLMTIMSRVACIGLCAFALCEPTDARAQDPVFQDWSRRFDASMGLGGPNPKVYSDTPKALYVNTQGNAYVLLLTERANTTGGGYVVMRYDSHGGSQRLAGLGEGGEMVGRLIAIVADPAGNFVVTGTSGGGGQYSETSIVTRKYNSEGIELWTQVFDRSPVVSGNYQYPRADEAVALAIDANGAVYLTGKTQGCTVTGTCWVEHVVLKYDANGTKLWETLYNGGTQSHTVPSSMALSGSGDVIVGGSRGIIRYSSTGALLCESVGNGDGDVAALTSDAQGNVYTVRTGWGQAFASGNARTYSHEDIHTVKYSPNCAEQWRSVYDGAKDIDRPSTVVTDGGGNVFLTGLSCSPQRNISTQVSCSSGYNEFKNVTVKYSPAGAQLWSARTPSTVASALGLDQLGNAHVFSRGSAPSPSFVVKYAATDGQERWRIAFSTGDPGTPCCLGVDSQGNVFVVGRTVSMTQFDLGDVLTVKYIHQEDIDGDGVLNTADNCRYQANPDQSDTDGDGHGNVCDNCPTYADPTQVDTDRDGAGDGCDNCRTSSNADQADGDSDGIGDVCDNCRNTANSNQADADGDGVGDVCDNCRNSANQDQRDTDGDGNGNACDADDDNDGVQDGVDNCSLVRNVDQRDTDSDGVGNACNDAEDTDSDEWSNALDNCPSRFNPNQADINGDGVGDVCAIDLRVVGFEVTQGIQGLDNRVPLVTGKRTWVRVRVDIGAVPTTVEVPGVTGELRCWGPNGSSIMVRPTPEFIIGREPPPGRAAFEGTLNFRLPEQCRIPDSPTVPFNVVLNPAGTVTEIDYTNNTSNLGTREFYPAATLNVAFVAVVTPQCQRTPTVADFLETSRWLRTTYPIPDIQAWNWGIWAIAVDPTANVFDGAALWDDLWWINALTDDPVENLKYYGLVCGELDAPGLSGASQIGMGLGDQAWGIRNREGSATTPETFGGALMAQEVAHTFLGPSHAPGCGSLSPHFDDFPTGSGRIDDIGFDGARTYAQVFDFMSYCSPNWVSKYTYRKLFDEFWPYGLVP